MLQPGLLEEDLFHVLSLREIETGLLVHLNLVVRDQGLGGDRSVFAEVSQKVGPDKGLPQLAQRVQGRPPLNWHLLWFVYHRGVVNHPLNPTPSEIIIKERGLVLVVIIVEVHRPLKRSLDPPGRLPPRWVTISVKSTHVR